MRRALPAASLCALVVAAGAGAGCGGPRSPDLFAVQRTGDVPGAQLNLVVNDGGTARCNGRRAVQITDPQLLQARYLQGQLSKPATKHLALAPGREPVLRYYVRTPAGQVAFSDDSAGQPLAFYQLAALVRTIAKQDCRLAR